MLLTGEESKYQWSEILFEKLWPTIVFLVALIVVGVFGNLLVFCVYLNRFRPSAARVFILAMAVCDFLTNVISLPLMIFQLRHFYNSPDNPTCKFMQTSWRFPTIMSVGLLVWVAIDRHRSICFPFKRQMTHRHAMLILLFLLITTVLLSSPFLVFYGQNRSGRTVICYIEDQYIASPWIKRTIILLIVYFAISLVILMICYIHIVCRVQRLKVKRQRRGGNQPNKDDHGQQSKCSSDYKDPQQALDSQNNSSQSDREKDNSSSLPSPGTSSEDATVSSNTSLIMKNIAGAQQRNEKKSENLRHFKVTEEERKAGGKRTKTRNEGDQKKTRFSKTTLMMLVLTLTTIVLFVPHLIIELFVGGCLNVGYTLMKMNTCQVAHLFPYLNSVINPFIYSFCNPKFRLQCKLFLRGVYNFVFPPVRSAFIRDSASR